MIATFKLNVDELSAELLNSIKAAFKNKTIEITVSEASDETSFLLASAANAAHLNKSIQQGEEGKVVVFTIDEFQKQYGK